MFMPSGIDLNQIFLFPVKDTEARKYFLIGCAVALAGFIIPVVPYLVLFGYAARIAKQIFNGEAPRMVAWDNWGKMLQDGARMFGVRMVYTLPIFIIAIPLMIAGIAMPFITENVNSADANSIIIIFSMIMLATLCLVISLSLPLTAIIPAAEMHAVDKNEFAAGFRFGEWWQIFRANLGGFIAAFVIYYVASLVLTFALQIIMATLILSCLLPILLPGVTAYLMLTMYATIAQAYKGGKDKIAQKNFVPANI
jgi:hypothetical protein